MILQLQHKHQGVSAKAERERDSSPKLCTSKHPGVLVRGRGKFWHAIWMGDSVSLNFNIGGPCITSFITLYPKDNYKPVASV